MRAVIAGNEPFTQPTLENRFTRSHVEPFQFTNDLVDTFNRSAGRPCNILPLPLPQNPPATRRHARIAVKTNGTILFTDSADVIALLAQGNYTVLQREASSYLVRESISALAAKLRPYGFIQIHRSVLVNASFVEEIRPRITGEYRLRVKGGKEYTVTRTYKKNLKSLAELWVGMDTSLAG